MTQRTAMLVIVNAAWEMFYGGLYSYRELLLAAETVGPPASIDYASGEIRKNEQAIALWFAEHGTPEPLAGETFMLFSVTPLEPRR